MDASLLTIQPTASDPIYRQIVDQLRRLIASGQLISGEALPSVRDVAGFHAINPMTVSRAYSLAEAEGLLERQRGKSMVVATRRGGRDSEAERLQLLEPALRDISHKVLQLELAAEPVLKRLQQLLAAP